MTAHIEALLQDILIELRTLREQSSRPRKDWLTINEVAELWSISPKTVRNQLSAGKFPVRPRRVGGKVLFKASDLEALPAQE